MDTLLTIAIPTFNRGALLDRQLAWLAAAVRGHEDQCELLISDNASTDATAEIVARWAGELRESGLRVEVNRNETNLGAIRNIAHCINHASGRFVWTISDDDELDADAVGRVLDILRCSPELALLVLNFSSRHVRTGQRKFSRCFENSGDEQLDNGAPLVEKYLADPSPSRWGGLALTTALVYRTSTAQAALRSWPGGLSNLTVQLYVTAFCAKHGATHLTHRTFLEMIGGRHFFEEDKRLQMEFRLAQVPEAFERLAAIGYSTRLCRSKILGVMKEVRPRFVAERLLNDPQATTATLSRYIGTLLRTYRWGGGPGWHGELPANRPGVS